jgi:hypothetical protein
MKRIITILSICFLVSFISHAQRQVNLEIIMVNPVNSLLLNQGDPFYLDLIVKNLGPDTLILSDETKIQLIINNVPVMIVNGSGTDSFMRYTQKYLLPNDTFVSTSPPIYTNQTGPVNFCIKTILSSNNLNPVIDPDITNNNSCAAIYIAPLSVKASQIETDFTVYPIPASDYISWELDGGASEKEISIYNLQAKLSFKETSYGDKGRIDVRNLPAGIYVLRIKDSENRLFSKRFEIN